MYAFAESCAGLRNQGNGKSGKRNVTTKITRYDAALFPAVS